MPIIKDCLIVAAGKGTRLKGFGDLKPLVNLCGKPLIEHAMLSASKAGVENFVVVTGYKAGILDKFLCALRKKYRWKITIVNNPDFELENGLSVLAAEAYLSEDFFLSMCDHVVEPEIYTALSRADLPNGNVGLGIDIRLTNPDVDINDVTKVNVSGGIISGIGKDLRNYNAYDCGIFRANHNLFDAIKTHQDLTGECSISGGMKILAKHNRAHGINIGNTRWIDVDCPHMHHIAHKWQRSLMKSKVQRIDRMQTQNIVAVGHRGTKKFAPENTLAAHEVAFALGARAIEFDVRCTKDGHFVLMHDSSVRRTTDGRGRVKDMTLAQIKKLDAGIHKGPEFAGEKIPTLREALRNVKGRFVVDIDFKGGPKNSAELLANVFEEEGFATGPLITIFARWYHFKMLQSLCPQYALRPHYISRKWTNKLVRDFPLEIMGLRRRSFNFKRAKNIRNNNLHLFCNTMGFFDNERGFADSIKADALFIQTDHLDKLIPYLEKHDLLETGVMGRDYQPITLDEEVSVTTSAE